MAAKSRSSVSGMQSPFFLFAEDERLYDFELARAHRPDPRGPERADALLRTAPRVTDEPAASVADSRPRTRLQCGPSSVAVGAVAWAPPPRSPSLVCGLLPFPSRARRR